MKNFSQITENLDVANKKYVDDELDKLARTVNNGALTLTVNGTAHTFTANQSGDTSVTINDTGVTSVSVSGDGNAVTNASIDGRALTLTKGTTFLTSQSIKTLNTNNTTAQTTSASETIVGSGTINLHKIAKTGNYNDLLDKLTAGSNITINENNVISAKDTTYTFTANNPTLAWNTTSKIGTIGGVEFNVTMPANPNTHHTNYLQIKGNNTEAVKFTQNADKTLNFKPGANVSISATSGEITISSTDTNTATAADNILDGSNSGTQITYAPYTSQQSKLSFDSSNTEPTRSDRLNLNGYLHATKLYSGGKEVLTSHQSIKSLNTNNTTAQDANASEAIVGSGAINLHKIAKTGSYGDLNNKPNRARHNSTLLATNTDLNTLNSSDNIGWYHVGGGNNCAHKPTGVDAFGLEVGRSAGGWFYQVLTSSNASTSRGRRFIRTYNGTEWGGWKKIAITSDIPAVHDGTLTIQKNGTEVATFTANSALNTIANIKVPSTFDDLSRIKKQDYAGNNNAVKYFKLATFPVYNSDENYASFIITGRMGGWESGNMSFVNMILYNRGSEGGAYINVANSSFFNLCDIVMYREADGTSTAYLKVKGYYTFDININTYQATNVYTGTDVPPTGTLKWTASANADRLAVSGGKVYVNGFMMPKQIRINDTVRNPDANAVIDLGTVPASYTTSSLTPSKCTKNGFYYVISSTNSLTDADGNPFLQYHTSDKDFRILTTAYSDSWVQQIATDLRTNHIFYRIRNNGTWGAWQKMMNAEEFTLSGTTLTITM